MLNPTLLTSVKSQLCVAQFRSCRSWFFFWPKIEPPLLIWDKPQDYLISQYEVRKGQSSNLYNLFFKNGARATFYCRHAHCLPSSILSCCYQPVLTIAQESCDEWAYNSFRTINFTSFILSYPPPPSPTRFTSTGGRWYQRRVRSKSIFRLFEVCHCLWLWVRARTTTAALVML